MKLPALGESVTEGTVTRWLKQVGDEVAVDEPLLEVSTDKVDTEIPSPVAGTLLEIKVNEDETVEVGAELGVIGSGKPSGGDSDSSGESAEGGDDTGGGGEDKAQERAEEQQKQVEEQEPEAKEEPEPEPKADEKPEPEKEPEPEAKEEPAQEKEPEPSLSQLPQRRAVPTTAPGTSLPWSASSPRSTTSTCPR